MGWGGGGAGSGGGGGAGCEEASAFDYFGVSFSLI